LYYFLFAVYHVCLANKDSHRTTFTAIRVTRHVPVNHLALNRPTPNYAFAAKGKGELQRKYSRNKFMIMALDLMLHR